MKMRGTPVRNADKSAGISGSGLLWRVLLALILLGFAACSRPSDEQQIRAALAAMQEAVESAKPSAFMDYVAEDFTGDGGNVDRAALHNLLRAQVLSNAHIGVTLSSIEVELQGDRATVTVDALMTGGNGQWIPEHGSIRRIQSGWRKSNGGWLCINAQWETPD
jgi:ketosteroid isomerase-like protein